MAVNQEAAILSITGTLQCVRDEEVIVTETGHFFPTDEHLEVINTSLWGLREVTEENKRSKIHNTYLTTRHLMA